MDPDAALDELLDLADLVTRFADADGERTDGSDVLRLAELVLALDGWLTASGFLPTRWKPAARRSA
jgi:hypothetical protein